MNLDQLLGLDFNSPSMRRAQALADADRALLRDLIHIRKERGLTQTEVGEILGISQASVAAFEAHDSNPTLATIRRYAHAVEALVSHEVTKDTAEDSWQPMATVTPLFGFVPSRMTGPEQATISSLAVG